MDTGAAPHDQQAIDVYGSCMTSTIRPLLLGVCLLGATAPPVAACSIGCVLPDERGAAYRAARAVFSGRVVARQETISERPFGDMVTDIVAEIAVDTQWKGAARDTIVVHSWTSSLCGGGEPLYLGDTYLVWAHVLRDTPDAPLEAGFCTRTQRLEYAAEDLEFLDATTATADGGCQVGPRPGSGGWAVLAPALLLALRRRHSAIDPAEPR